MSLYDRVLTEAGLKKLERRGQLKLWHLQPKPGREKPVTSASRTTKTTPQAEFKGRSSARREFERHLNEPERKAAGLPPLKENASLFDKTMRSMR